jgi:hypothetical protein
LAEGAANIKVSALCREGEQMAVFLITGAIIGILLGLRFKVLVLVPASVLAAVAVIINGSADKLSVIVLTLVGTLVSLQVGYAAGSVIRFLAHGYLPAWMRDRRSEPKC